MLRGIGAAVAVLLVVAGRVALDAVGVGVGHTAKTLCSGVFVSGRDPAAVRGDLQRDDLALLRYVDTAVDSTRHSVTATALGVLARRAVYREGLGCALVLDGLPPKWDTKRSS
jgi:hypothetical protein